MVAFRRLLTAAMDRVGTALRATQPSCVIGIYLNDMKIVRHGRPYSQSATSSALPCTHCEPATEPTRRNRNSPSER